MLKRVVIILAILYSYNGLSQEIERRFNPVLSAGIVGSQVDGDTYGGYRKAGIMLGILVNRQFSEKMEYELGISYIQKGARKNPDTTDMTSGYLFRTNYVELPLLLKYNYKKFKIEGGISYAYMFKYSEYRGTIGYYNTYPPLKRDWSYIIGCGYKLNENTLITLRHAYSLVPIRKYNAQGIYLGNFWTRFFNGGLYNNLISLNINYTFKSNNPN